jgi:hypothetical protein
MMDKLDLVLQGPNYPYTQDIIEYYLLNPLIGNVILSCWENDPDLNLQSSKVKVIKTPDNLENPGIGNRNRQILSSKVGLSEVESNYCAKMRSDQKISHESLIAMHDFYTVKRDSSWEHSLFVVGMYTKFPFHPRDHVFWGQTRDIKELFDIDYDPEPFTKEPDYSKVLRAEAYLGMFYYSKYDKRVEKFIKDPATYLVDTAPLKSEAIEVYNEIRDEVFKVFPRAKMEWKKHNISWNTYPFDRNKQLFSEYWYEDLEK